MKTLLCSLAILCGLFSGSVVAAAPAVIDYQGFLRNAQGYPLNGPQDFVFILYGSLAGPDSVWSETHSAVNVDQGVFSVQLGGPKPFSPSIFQRPALFLEIRVGAQIMSPRTQLVSVPYALFTQVAQQAARADTAAFATRAAYADSAGKMAGGADDAHWAGHGNDIYNTNTGNVGIGTDNPQIKIDVENGDVGVHKAGMAALFAADQYGGNLWSNNGYDRSHPGDGWYRTMTWKDGNVGVGTTNPGERLDVGGNIKASGALYAASGMAGFYDGTNLVLKGSNHNYGGLGRVMVDMGQYLEVNYARDFPNGLVLNGPLLVHNGLTNNGTLDQMTGRILNVGTPVSPNDAATKEYVDSHVGGGTGYWGANGSSIYYNNGNVGVGTSAPESRFTVQCQQLTHRGLRITDGTNNSNIVIQPLPGENSGFQAINFNGYYDGTEVRLNPAKNRWRISADQRGASDVFSVDTQSQTGGTTLLAGLTNGNVGIGTTTPDARLHVSSSEVTDAGVMHVNATSATGSARAIFAETGASGSNSVGVFGQENCANPSTAGGTFGVFGRILRAQGTTGNSSAGVFGDAIGNGDGSDPDHYPDAFDALANGVQGETWSVNNSAAGGKFFAAQGSGQADAVFGQTNSPDAGSYALYGSGPMLVTGSKSSGVYTASQGPVEVYSVEATGVWFEDIGEGRLEQGRAMVMIDPVFLETVAIDGLHTYHVFVQFYDDEAMGGCVVRRSAKSFEVIEKNNGRSNASFSYRITAKRKYYEDRRMRPVPIEVDRFMRPDLSEGEIRALRRN
jgi:hypothetical protein